MRTLLDGSCAVRPSLWLCCTAARQLLSQPPASKQGKCCSAASAPRRSGHRRFKRVIGDGLRSKDHFYLGVAHAAIWRSFFTRQEFDGLGSFVFALSGGLLAVQKRFDLFGVLVLSFVVAVTGGIT